MIILDLKYFRWSSFLLTRIEHPIALICRWIDYFWPPPREVIFGRKPLDGGYGLAHHWAIKVGKSWYEVEGTTIKGKIFLEPMKNILKFPQCCESILITYVIQGTEGYFMLISFNPLGGHPCRQPGCPKKQTSVRNLNFLNWCFTFQ